MSRRLMLTVESHKPEQPINVNLIDSATIRQNYYLNDDGGLTYDNMRRTSDYIPVYFGNSYLKSTPSNRDSKIAVYDSNKQFIRILNYGHNQAYITFYPIEGDAFIRVGGAKTGSNGSTSFSFKRTP